MRILLADDHTLFRDALVQYIQRAKPESDTFTARNFNEAYDILEQQPALDLVLLDLRMPGMHGLLGLEKIRQTHPDLKVAIMSGLAEPEDVTQAIDMGAAGYFPKTLSGQSLIKAIELVLSGERFVPIDHATHGIMPSYQNDPEIAFSRSSAVYGGMAEEQAPFDHARAASLTPREKEVLQHLARGESNKEIARALDLQVVTVKLHVRGICKKLDASNRTQAALKAREMGLTRPAAELHHG